MPTWFQWLKDSPRLYLRSPLHVNECVERFQQAVRKGDDAFSPGTTLGGRIRWYSFVLYPVPRGWLTPSFNGRLMRLDTGTLISGHFGLRKHSKLRLAVMMLGLAVLLFCVPAFLAPPLCVIAYAVGWPLAAVVLVGSAFLKPVGEDTIALSISFLEETFQAQLRNRVE